MLASFLEAHGNSVWWDRTIPPGRVFDEVIQEALAAAQCVVVLWSSNSVRSNWVKVEAEEAAARGLLVPVLIEHVTPPIQFKRIQAANLSDWRGDENHPEFRNLMAAIQQLLGRPPSAVAPQRVVRTAPAGLSHTVRTVAWSVGATLTVVAAVWLYSWRGTSSGGAEPASASAVSPTATTGSVNTPAPTPSGVPSTPANSVPPAGPKGDLLNLLDAENGGEMITAQVADWARTVDGNEGTYLWAGPSEAVFGFKDGRSATLEGVEILIKGSDQYNVSEFEVLTSTDTPEGPFKSIQVFKPKNMLIVKEPYQRTLFAPRTARYVKVRTLKAHSNTAISLYEWRLLGTLD